MLEADCLQNLQKTFTRAWSSVGMVLWESQQSCGGGVWGTWRPGYPLGGYRVCDVVAWGIDVSGVLGKIE